MNRGKRGALGKERIPKAKCYRSVRDSQFKWSNAQHEKELLLF